MNSVNLGKKPVADRLNEDTRSTAPDGIQVNQLARDDELSITTTNNTYHVTVIDPETAQVRVRGGNIFRTDTIAEIAGSSSDSSFKPLGVYVGYCIEFFQHERRVRTSPVRVVRLLARSERAA
jgi:hypothetical protein